MPRVSSPFQRVPNTPLLLDRTGTLEGPLVPEICNSDLKGKQESPNASATVPSTPQPQIPPMEPVSKANSAFPKLQRANVAVFVHTEEQQVPHSPVTRRRSSTPMHATNDKKNSMVIFSIAKKKDRASIKRRRVILLGDGLKSKLQRLKPIFSKDADIFD